MPISYTIGPFASRLTGGQQTGRGGLGGPSGGTGLIVGGGYYAWDNVGPGPNAVYPRPGVLRAAQVFAPTAPSGGPTLITDADVGALTEAVALLLVTFTGTDSVAATEAAAVLVLLTQNDSLAAAEAAAVVVTLSAADTLTATESTVVLVSVSGTDTVTATEGASVVVLVTATDSLATTDDTATQAGVSGVDAIAATEAIALMFVTLAAADTLASAEIAQLLVMLAVADGAALTENQFVDAIGAPIAMADADTLTATEDASVFAFVPAPVDDTGGFRFPSVLPVRHVRTAAGELVVSRENAWIDVVSQAVFGEDRIRATESASARKLQSGEQVFAAITLWLAEERG